MTDGRVFKPELADRASPPALSDISELTVLSRSPSPVPGYQGFFQTETEFPSTPPSTPGRLRATDGRFTSRSAKRPSSSVAFGPSKRLRSPREPGSLSSPTCSWNRPRTPRKYVGDAVLLHSKPVLPAAAPWVAGKGGCGTLAVLPKEIRQKIYSLAFDVDTPVTIKECCGPDTTARERGACRKHGSCAAFKHGRFNILQISKVVRIETSWVVLTQGLLVLKVGKTITRYLGCYRWNGQRCSSAVQPEKDHKATMWTSVGQYRHVKIDVCGWATAWCDPAFYTKTLVEVASSLCQSGDHRSPLRVMTTEIDSRRIIEVGLDSLFQSVIPFNATSEKHEESRALWIHSMGYSMRHRGEPDLQKMAADSGGNLLRLVATVAKYRGLSQWKFVADTQLNEENEGGIEWLRTFQAECAGYGILLEHGSCESDAD